MNKHIVMVLAVIVTVLTGWLVLSIAQMIQNEVSEEQGVVTQGGVVQISDPIPVPSFAEIQLTVVESLDDGGSNVTAEVVAN